MMGTEDGIELELPSSSTEWIVFNVDQVGKDTNQKLIEKNRFLFTLPYLGYYRVNYDETNWKLISKQLQQDHEVLSVLNRAQLLDDSLNIARTGALAYSVVFELAEYLRMERDFTPWSSALKAFNYLDRMLYQTASRDSFRVTLMDKAKLHRNFD